MPDSTGRQHSRRQIPAQKTLTGRPRPLHPSSWRDFGPQDRVEFSSSEFHCAKTAHLYSNCGDAETHRSICRLSEEKPESDSTHGWRQESFAWLKTRHGVAGSLRCLLIVTSGGPLLSLVATRFLFQGRGFRACRAPHTACCCTSRR